MNDFRGGDGARGPWIPLRIIRWNSRRASTSDNRGEAWGCKGRKVWARRALKLKKLPSALIQRGAWTGFNK